MDTLTGVYRNFAKRLCGVTVDFDCALMFYADGVYDV